MKQQDGFTFIEFIIVMTILGVAAVSATPKLIDTKSNAHAATLKGVQAALKVGSQLVYAKSVVAGKQKNPSTFNTSSQITLGKNPVETDFGYPDAEAATFTSVKSWGNIHSTQLTLIAGTLSNPQKETPASGTIAFFPTGNAHVDFTETGESGLSCHALYTEAANEYTPPIVTVVTGSC
ncbi:MAG: prepilin-type N-terminal cleavage/methylation domain-containing protein [Paraglaciecola sp.]|uniref:type II secretion system protein n=1 Tax=Paraglaciecola sp. TaxID=1920173 RepID=UPI0032988F5C